jgi:hypothetical protein
MSKYVKIVLLYLVLPVVVVLSARVYILDWATMSFKFGCDTAAERVYRFNSKALGRELQHFCVVYTGNIKKEFGDGFDH